MPRTRVIISIFTLTFLVSNFLLVLPSQAAVELVKSADFGTIYYIDSLGIRHPFSNETVYRSWYGQDFSKVVTVSNEFLAKYPLGKNITIKPGTYLVKVRTTPQVYAVEPGGVLRQIENESVAQDLYGPAWAKRVVDIADVFFGDYTIGKNIKHNRDIPDGVLYQDKETKTYYYKNNGAIQPFASPAAIKANGFALTDAVISEYSFLFTQRERPIKDFDKRIFNLTAQAVVDRRDCENKNLRAAVVFVAKDKYQTEELDRLEKVKSQIKGRFEWATDKLSTIDVSYPTMTLVDDGYLLTQRNDGTYDLKDEVVSTFYDQNEDDFDFLIIWTNFKIPAENTNEIANFSPVVNRQLGINRDPVNSSRFYGTHGKLKGIIVMGNINKYHPETESGMNEVLNLVLHEFLHQWSAYISFIDEKGENNLSLLRSGNYQHWSYYAGFLSPVGGSGWVDNGDGTFTSELSKMADTNLRQFSPLDLYLMGLIPYQLMEPVFYVEPTVANSVGNTISGKAKWVTVDQIIAAHDYVSCNPF